MILYSQYLPQPVEKTEDEILPQLVEELEDSEINYNFDFLTIREGFDEKDNVLAQYALESMFCALFIRDKFFSLL